MPLPKVQTTLGALPAEEARALLDMLSHDGIIPLRRLMKARNVVATTILRSAACPPERMKYEAGALDFILELDGILDGGLREAYASAVESQQEPAPHGRTDTRARPGEGQREGADVGPE